jgi:hypothetical protein
MTAMAPPAVEFGAQPIVVEGLAGEQGADDDAGDQRFDADAVVSLTRQQDEARQIAERIDKRDDFGRQTTTRSPDCLILSPLSAGAMLVDPDDRAVDHGVFEIRIAG